MLLTSGARRRSPRVAVALVLAVVVVALASGCVGLRGISGAQQGQIGSVRVTATVCAADTAGCNGRGNSNSAPGDGAVGQVLLGFRIPAASPTPAAPAAPGLVFAEDGGYAAELQRLAPAPAGTRWVGYLSAPFTYTAAAAANGLPVTADIALPVVPGVPFAGPLRYRPVVGARSVGAQTPATRPVACGPSLTRRQADGADGVIVCVDSPSAGQLASDLSTDTQDLTIVPGATDIPARGGSVVAVPFTLRHGGKGPALAVTLSATSSMKRAAVAPSPATLVPAPGGEHQVLVVVGVPAGARASRHGVTLRATLPSGEFREMSTRLVVKPAGAVTRPTSSHPRSVRLGWRPDRRAAFYNLQVFSRTRKVASLFPESPRRQVRLRPGRYRIVVWSGLGRTARGRYASRPWVNRLITLRPAPSKAARGRPVVVRLR